MLAWLAGSLVQVAVVAGPCLTDGVVREAVAGEMGDRALDDRLRVRVVEGDRQTTIELFADGVLVSTRVIDTSAVIACAGLARAVALSVAISLDAFELTRPEPPAAVAQQVESYVAPQIEPDVEPQVEPRVAPPARLRWAVGLEAGGAIGATPTENPTVGLDAELAYPLGTAGLRGELSARAGFFGALPMWDEIGNGEVRVGVAAGRLDGCIGVGAELLRGRICGSALVGALAAAGADDEVWVRAGGRVDGAVWPVRMLGLTVAVDALANLAPSYVERTGAMGELSELGPASLMFAGGVLVPLD